MGLSASAPRDLTWYGHDISHGTKVRPQLKIYPLWMQEIVGTLPHVCANARRDRASLRSPTPTIVTCGKKEVISDQKEDCPRCRHRSFDNQPWRPWRGRLSRHEDGDRGDRLDPQQRPCALRQQRHSEAEDIMCGVFTTTVVVHQRPRP